LRHFERINGIAFAYFHHLYTDFAQPVWIQKFGQVVSYSCFYQQRAAVLAVVWAFLLSSREAASG